MLLALFFIISYYDVVENHNHDHYQSTFIFYDCIMFCEMKIL